jgi:hypothetical protein
MAASRSPEAPEASFAVAHRSRTATGGVLAAAGLPSDQQRARKQHQR